LSITSGADATVAPDEYSIAGKKPFSLKTDLRKAHNLIDKSMQ
jgi:hypothetical protein